MAKDEPKKEDQKKEDPREIISQYKSYEAQLKTILEEIRKIENTMVEYNLAIEAIQNMQKSKDADLLVPIGANSFVYAKLSDNENILTGVGSDILVKKTADASTDIIKKNIEAMQKNVENLSTIAKNLENRLVELAPKIQPYVRQ